MSNKSHKIYKVLNGIYNDSELRSSIVPLFLGDPGIGKTKIIEAFVDDVNAKIKAKDPNAKKIKLIEFIVSQKNPYEISGMAMPDQTTQKMAIWNFDAMENLQDGDIIFFDEVLNGNPVVLNACLTLLESRKMLSGQKLPDVMIVAAANPQGAVYLQPQVKERFVFYNVAFSSASLKRYMLNKDKQYFLTENIVDVLALNIKEEDFKNDGSTASITCNYLTPRSVDKAINMIIKGVDTPYSTKLGATLGLLVANPLGEDIELKPTKGDKPGSYWGKDETRPWIEVAQLIHKAKK
jgi:hypothetical protein